MCVNRKFDRELKDKVAIIVPTLVTNHKALNDLLQQKGRLSNDLEKVVRSTLKTFQGLTQQDLAEYTKGESGRAEWEDAWERYERQDSFQEAF